MTIKEAFEKLHKAVKKAGLNPFFLIGNLKDEFKDIADNIVDSGSIVEVEPAQTSGFLVGNIKVNGENHYLYSIPQPPQPHIYSDTERLVAVWFHGGVSEDVYERVISVGALPNNTLKTIEIPTGLKIMSLTGTAINPTNGVTLPIPYVSLGGGIGSVNVSAGNGVISITTDTNREPFTDTNIIIRYVKRT